MQHQFSIFILAFGALQGVLLSFLLLRTRAYRGNSLFLLLYLLVLLLQICMKLASKIWLTVHLPSLYRLSYDLPLLYGPLLWLFLRRTLSPKTTTPQEWVHFLPFVGLVLLHFLALADLTARYWYYSANLAVSLQCVSLIVYHGLGLKIIQKNQAALESNTLKWLKELVFASLLLTLTLTVTLYWLYVRYPLGAELRYLFAIATLFIYWVSYKIMRWPHLVIPSWDTTVLGLPQSGKKYQHSTLQVSDMQLIVQQLAVLMQHQRPYLDPKLSIDDLAALVGCNRHHLSQVLNECLQKNYYEYLNTYRIELAQVLLLDPAQAHLKIAAIAYTSGFNSLSTFNEVFKKMLGCTPSEFRKMEQEKMAYTDLSMLPNRSDR